MTLCFQYSVPLLWVLLQLLLMLLLLVLLLAVGCWRLAVGSGP